MLMYLGLGCVMDAMAMVILTIPIVITDIVRLCLLIAFPAISTWLPGQM